MAHHTEPNTNYSLYYILAIICGILTAWIISGSIPYIILGAILGWLLAVFYINVLVKDRDY